PAGTVTLYLHDALPVCSRSRSRSAKCYLILPILMSRPRSIASRHVAVVLVAHARHGDPDGRAAIRRRRELEAAAVRLRDALHDREPEARARRARREERLEDSR